jgi:Cu/Ag efflux protein CusF
MHLRRTMIGIAVILFSATSWAAKGTTYSAHGLVKAVDATAHTVTIDHDDIPGLMPRMTMEFSVTDSAALSAIKIGERVDFSLRDDGGKFVVTEIHPAKQ